MLRKTSTWKHLLFCLLFLLPIAVTHAQTGWWANPTEPRLYQYSGSLTTPDLIQVEIEDESGKKILHGREALIFLLNRHYVAYNPTGQLYFTDKFMAWARSRNESTPGFGKLFNSIVAGGWSFGPVGSYYGPITFTSEPGQYGYKLDYPHKNESFWNVTNNGELLIRGFDGKITSRLIQRSENYWEGPFLDPYDEFRGHNITHYIKREASLFNTIFPRDQHKRFNFPSIDGIPLDWCHTWATDCGHIAAVAFCQKNGYADVVDVGPKAKPPQGVTKLISNGQICRGAFCDTFEYITCGK